MEKKKNVSMNERDIEILKEKKYFDFRTFKHKYNKKGKNFNIFLRKKQEELKNNILFLKK